MEQARLGSAGTLIDYRLARCRDSVVGEPLSTLLCPILGISLVLFRHQLFHGWLWGHACH